MKSYPAYVIPAKAKMHIIEELFVTKKDDGSERFPDRQDTGEVRGITDGEFDLAMVSMKNVAKMDKIKYPPPKTAFILPCVMKWSSGGSSMKQYQQLPYTAARFHHITGGQRYIQGGQRYNTIPY
ncbi:hypothetical protein QE152_g21641 [Popillia japonica]|uniref:Uncharacterized protein n=1 Tax=Popillia japonica TaxID=7064 RepID=A0AAW1KNS4_POPJA